MANDPTHETAVKWKDQLVEVNQSAATWSPPTGWVAGYDEIKGVLIEPSDPNAGWNIQNSAGLWGMSSRPKPKRGYWVHYSNILGPGKKSEKLTAKEIAERYKGQILQVRKDYHDHMYGKDDNVIYGVRILGFRETTNEVMGGPPDDDAPFCWSVDSSTATRYVLVSPAPKYGWWFGANAFIIPNGNVTKASVGKKDIPPWPHTCPGCKGPALHMGTTMVDCKAACKPQYTYRSGR